MRKVEFRVFDLYEGKVLYDDQIPQKGEGLIESIRQLSGQTYELSQYTEINDINGNKIYEGDIVDILRIKISDNEELKVNYNKIGSGVVEYSIGIPSVTFIKDHELCYLSLDDRNHEFKITGNRLENKGSI